MGSLEITKVNGSDLPLNFIEGYLNQWFDMDRDLSPFYSNPDPAIKTLTSAFSGLRMVAMPDLFEANLLEYDFDSKSTLHFAYHVGCFGLCLRLLARGFNRVSLRLC